MNPKGLVVFYIFQGLIHIFKDDFTKFQDIRHFFQFPGVFQDVGQIQELFHVCFCNHFDSWGFFWGVGVGGG